MMGIIMNQIATGSNLKKSQKRINTEQSILDAALTLFAKNGFDRTSTKQIAELSGYSEGLIFKYFRDKSQLYLTIFSKWMNGTLEAFRQLPSSNTLKQELQILVRAYIDNYEEHLDLLVFHFDQVHYFENSEEFESIQENFLQQRFEILSTRIKPYNLQQQIDVELLINTIRGYVSINLLFHKWTKEEYDFRVEQFVELLLNGLQ